MHSGMKSTQTREDVKTAVLEVPAHGGALAVIPD